MREVVSSEWYVLAVVIKLGMFFHIFKMLYIVICSLYAIYIFPHYKLFSFEILNYYVDLYSCTHKCSAHNGQ